MHTKVQIPEDTLRVDKDKPTKVQIPKGTLWVDEDTHM